MSEQESEHESYLGVVGSLYGPGSSELLLVADSHEAHPDATRLGWFHDDSPALEEEAPWSPPADSEPEARAITVGEAIALHATALREHAAAMAVAGAPNRPGDEELLAAAAREVVDLSTTALASLDDQPGASGYGLTRRFRAELAHEAPDVLLELVTDLKLAERVRQRRSG